METQASEYEAEFTVPKPWRIDESSVSRPVPVRVRESVAELLETKEGSGSRVDPRGVQWLGCAPKLGVGVPALALRPEGGA